MNLGVFAAVAYGILAIAGGIFGYVKARSKPSLISGIVSGLLLLLGGLGQQQGMSWGLLLSVGVTIVLIVVFAIRFAKTRKFMPAGLMILAGILALVGLLSASAG
ncbi:hypothetical protein IFO70_04500 [Phormidium tenue FACHB-886]|nr:hypothetical protein [Phormidium tenue FACHB-886]